MKLEDLALYQRSATAALPALHYPVLASLGEALVQLRRASRAQAPQGGAEAVVEKSPIDALEILDLEDSDTVHFESEATLEIPPEIFRDYDIRDVRTCSVPRLSAIGGQSRRPGSRHVFAGGRNGCEESSPLLREHLVQDCSPAASMRSMRGNSTPCSVCLPPPADDERRHGDR
jgi:hypothetical protein